jgi:hypothetical protein
LGCNSAATPDEAWIKLRKYIEEPFVIVTFYGYLIDSLRYVCHTRSDIAYLFGLVSRYMYGGA